MRLLNTATLHFEEFYSDIPNYAILSHTWGSLREEVTFQDMNGSNIEYKSKTGFHKIERCSQQARRDGLHYLWVDTCCIDKSSSAELTEAINSMFVWYRNSVTCYVYLVDVDLGDISINVDHQFKEAKWFRRGWTLQELLAPRLRLFFDSNWRKIATLRSNKNPVTQACGFHSGTNDPANDSLIVKIGRITGIPRSVLQTGNFHSLPTSHKMSWASKRETTRVEDMAYCLLGIFDINMPLLYGEGRRAFIRLQEEIVKKHIDHTLFAWVDNHAKESTFYGLLASSPAQFLNGDRLTLTEKDETPYEMTNRGLHIKLPLIQAEDNENEYFARLGTRTPTSTEYILLQRISVMGQFARVDAHRVFDDRDIFLLSKRGAIFCDIYVKQHIDEALVMLCRRRASAIMLRSNTRVEAGMMTIESMTCNGTVMDISTSRFPLIKGKELAIRIGLRATSHVYFVWSIDVEDGLNTECRLALRKYRGDIHGDELKWKRSLVGAWGSRRRARIFSKTSQKVLDGELVIEVCLEAESVLEWGDSVSDSD